MITSAINSKSAETAASRIALAPVGVSAMTDRMTAFPNLSIALQT
jgi:hypothetical protein